MNKNRKKIAILINSLVAGGCERTAAFLINNLSDKSEFYLIMFEDSIHYQVPDDTHRWIVDNVEQTGMNRLFYTLTIPMACRRIRRYLKEMEIDVLITFNHLPATIGCRIKKGGWSGLLVVNEQIHCSTYISSFSNFISRGLKKRLIAKLYPFADIIVANAEEIKNDLIENFSIDKQKIEVIGNPVDFSYIKTQALTKPKEVLVVKEQHEFIFIHIGRYVPQKNHNLLIEAFEKANIRNAKLWLIGGGEGFNEIHKLIIDKGLIGKIIQLGIQENPFYYLKQADTFILSSDYEGFPNVMLEALACDLPIISTNCLSGPMELLCSSRQQKLLAGENEISICDSGILTPVGNANALAKAMSIISEDEKLRTDFIKAGQVRVKDFDSNHILDLFKKLIFQPPD